MRRKAFGLWRILIALFVVLVLILFAIPVITTGTRIRPIDVRQQAQLHSMDAALELFNAESASFPPSDANDPTGKAYCGAMKLAEALMGRDLMGFHTQSVFRCDGLDSTGTVDLYPDVMKLDPALRAENLKARRGPFLQVENAKAFKLADVYGKGHTGPFPEDADVLCDTFKKKRPSGEETGMPILYYRANRLNRAHRAGDPNNVYDYRDNLALVSLGVPDDPNKVHPLIDPKRFYLNTQDVRVKSSPQPYRADSFILISAGWDGLYGTADDICNFEWKYREE